MKGKRADVWTAFSVWSAQEKYKYRRELCVWSRKSKLQFPPSSIPPPYSILSIACKHTEDIIMPGFIRLNRDGDDDNRPYTAESYGESVHPGDSPSIPTEASSDGQRPNTPESYGQRVYPPSESGNSEYAPSIPTGRGGQMSLPGGYQPGLDGYHQVSSTFSNSSVASCECYRSRF